MEWNEINVSNRTSLSDLSQVHFNQITLKGGPYPSSVPTYKCQSHTCIGPSTINGQRTELQDKKPSKTGRIGVYMCLGICQWIVHNEFNPFCHIYKLTLQLCVGGAAQHRSYLGVLLLSLRVFHVHVCCFYVMTHKSRGREKDMKGQTIELEIHNKLGMIANKLRQNRQCPTQ